VLFWIHQPTVSQQQWNPTSQQCSFLSYKQKFLSISCVSGTHSPKQRAWSVYWWVALRNIALTLQWHPQCSEKVYMYLHAKC
jgi:hypothetical protein